MENFNEVIDQNEWLLRVIENLNIEGTYKGLKQDIIDSVKENIEFLKWAEERILELEQR